MGFVVNRWDAGSTEFARLDGVSAVGFFQLLVTLRFRLRGLPKNVKRAYLRDFAARLHLSAPGGGESYLGQAIPQDAPRFVEHEKAELSVDRVFSVDVDHRCLDAVEAMRDGGDLRFSLTVRASHLGVAQQQAWVTDSCSFTVAQSDWVQLLDGLGYRKLLLLEVPAPDALDVPELAKAAGHLAEAQRLLGRGHAREAVGRCRDSLEAVGNAIGRANMSDLRALLNDHKSMNLDDRLKAVRYSLLMAAHPARHADECASRIEYGRDEAVFMLSQTASLLSLVSSRLSA